MASEVGRNRLRYLDGRLNLQYEIILNKNVFGICNDLYSSFFEKNHVTVMWSDCPENVYCEDRYIQVSDEIYLSHTPISSGLALVISRQTDEGVFPVPVVQVLSITRNSYLDYGDSDAAKEEYISIILAHEIAHTLGLGETYDTSSYDDAPHESGGGELCIMKKFNNSTLESTYGLEQPLCDECMDILRSEIVDDVYES